MTTMESLRFHALNFPPSSSNSTNGPTSSDISEFFTLNAQPGTSIWRSPGCHSNTTAPMIITCLRQPFLVAEVTVSADFEMEWDQGGLIIFAGAPPWEAFRSSGRRRADRRPNPCDSDSSVEEGAYSCGKWVKAGLEFTGGMLNASSVVAISESGADWSTSPLFPHAPAEELWTLCQSGLRVKFERIGDSLWIWYRILGAPSQPTPGNPESMMNEWRKLREVMGFFSGVEVKCGVWVGCYASRPMRFAPSHGWEDSGTDSNALVMEFEDFEIL